VSDPFLHLPGLRDRIGDPAESRFRLHGKGVEMWDEFAREAGYPHDWRHPDAVREESRRRTLAGREGRDLWVFAYGSLMWDPAFYFEEVRCATLPDFHRSFCLKLEIARGAPHLPGLMAALDRGGECRGIAFRIAASKLETETDILWRREMLTDGYLARFLKVQTPQGDIEALTFVADHNSPKYVSGLTREAAARLIASAHGVLGSNIEYLDELASRLEELNLPDPEFFELYALARAASGAGAGAKSPIRPGSAE
jgi:cation transport protein ChaC